MSDLENVPVLPEGYMNDVRKVKDELTGEVYFSVVDIIGKLTEQQDRDTARKYWKTLKRNKKREGIELVANCHQLKLVSDDGKLRKTDCATMEGMLRIIQEVPSPKAEPIKQWMAKVAKERLEEEADPSKAIKRGFDGYKKKGMSNEWIEARFMGIAARKAFTAELARRGVEGSQYGIVTDTVSKGWSGMTTKEYKKFKGIPENANLRDNMTSLELSFAKVAECTAKEKIKVDNAQGFLEVNNSCALSAEVTRLAMEFIEKNLTIKVVTSENMLKGSAKKKEVENNG